MHGLPRAMAWIASQVAQGHDRDSSAGIAMSRPGSPALFWLLMDRLGLKRTLAGDRIIRSDLLC